MDNETLELKDGGISEEEGYVLENDNPSQMMGPDFLERQKKHSNRKLLVPIDHDEMEYEPFRKNFYKGLQKFETRLKLKSRRIKRPCRSKK